MNNCLKHVRMMPDAAALLALLSLLSPAGLRADPPQWVPAGLEGATVNAVTCDGNTLYAGTADGLHILDTVTDQWLPLARDGAAGWPVTAAGRVAGQSAIIATGRTDPQGAAVLALTQRDGGATAVVATGLPGPVGLIQTIGYFGGNRMWAVAPAGAVLQSADFGATWVPVPGHGFTAPRGFSSTTDIVGGEIVSRTWLAGDDRLAWTADHGATWTPDVNGLPPTTVRDVHVGEVCFAVPAKGEFGPCSWVLAATDAGLFLRQYDADPWTLILDQPCVQARLCGGPLNAQGRAVVLTAAGRVLAAVLTLDRPLAPAWEDWTPEAGGAAVTVLDASHRFLAVGTAGAGVFTYTFPPASSPVPPAPEPLVLAASPNPFNPATELRFTAPGAGHARLEVFDVAGRRVATLLDGPVAAGPVRVPWRAPGLAGGIYMARLELDGVAATCRVALVR